MTHFPKLGQSLAGISKGFVLEIVTWILLLHWPISAWIVTIYLPRVLCNAIEPKFARRKAAIDA